MKNKRKKIKDRQITYQNMKLYYYYNNLCLNILSVLFFCLILPNQVLQFDSVVYFLIQNISILSFFRFQENKTHKKMFSASHFKSYQLQTQFAKLFNYNLFYSRTLRQFLQQSRMAQSTNEYECQVYSQLRLGSQFLSQILPWSQYGNLQTAVDNKCWKISLKSIEKLIVQNVYLTYFMQQNEISGYLYKSILIQNVNIQQQQVRSIFLSEAEKEGQKKSMQTFIQSSFSYIPENIDDSFIIALMVQKIDQILGFFKDCRLNNFILPNRINQAIIKTEFDEFHYIYLQFLKPKIKSFRSISQFVKALQQTRLFRQNSLLLQYNNNSVLVKILNNERCLANMKEVMQKFQKQRVILIRSQKKESSKCQRLMEDFFNMLVHNGIMQTSISLDDCLQGEESKKRNQNNEVKIGKLVDSNYDRSRNISFQISIQEKPYQFLTPQKLNSIIDETDTNQNEQKTNTAKKTNEFEITYKLLTNELTVKLKTSNFIKFQQLDSVNITLSSINSLQTSFQYSFEQNNKKTKVNDKGLVFWMHVTLHPKQNPFLSILQTIDKLLIYSIVLDYDIKLRNAISVYKKQIIIQELAYLNGKMNEIITYMNSN